MLGFILSPLGQEVPGQYPNEIAFQFGAGAHACYENCDPQYNQHGEPGLYHDTQLGGIPTDAQLAPTYGYTPVISGWVMGQEGMFPAPWRPPGGWNSAGQYGPQANLSGLRGLRDGDVTASGGATATVATPVTSEVQSIADIISAQNNRVFVVTIISSVVVGVAALINSYRLIKQLKRDEALLRKAAA